MITIYVEHFLSEEGRAFFADWIERVRTAISVQDGFVSLKDEVKADEEHGDWCASVLLEFEDKDKLDVWVATPEHGELVDNLDPYRTRPWKTKWDSPGTATVWFTGPEVAAKKEEAEAGATAEDDAPAPGEEI